MTDSPRLLKGAIVGLDKFNPTASAIVFQYNPNSMTRKLEPRTSGGDGDKSEAFRLIGPPKETISFKIELDATDRLAEEDPLTILAGVYPTLAALEMLVYPKFAAVNANLALSASGMIEIIPPEAPLALFIWGLVRVVPVRVTSLDITEKAWDTQLHPIDADVLVTLQVLSYHDLKETHRGFSLFGAYHYSKELMGSLNVSNSAQTIVLR